MLFLVQAFERLCLLVQYAGIIDRKPIQLTARCSIDSGGAG